MSNLVPPAPPADDDDRDEFQEEFRNEPPGNSRGSRRRRRSRPQRRPPTREELLLRLDAVANMLVLGAIEPSYANAIRSTIDSMLRAMGGSATATRTTGPIDPDRWREILRQNPGIADELAQFFSDEQLNEILTGFEDEGEVDDRTGNQGAA